MFSREIVRFAATHLTKAQVAQIAASIKEWGWTTPVLVDEAGGSFFCPPSQFPRSRTAGQHHLTSHADPAVVRVIPGSANSPWVEPSTVSTSKLCVPYFWFAILDGRPINCLP